MCVNDAESRLAERLVDELEPVLGTGILVRDLSIEGSGPVSITVDCLVDGTVRQIRCEGDTAVDAIGTVIRQAAELRLSAAFWQLVG